MVGALYLPFDVLDQGSMFTLSPSQTLLNPFGKNEKAENNLLNSSFFLPKGFHKLLMMNLWALDFMGN